MIWGVRMNKKITNEKKRIESKEDAIAYLDRLIYALESGNAKVELVKDRLSDKDKDQKYSNRHTLLKLFPDEDPIESLKRELATLTVEDYIETVKDTIYVDRSELRVFGKEYDEEDVYIKIRIELINMISSSGDNYILVLSFHFAEKNFIDDDFPYKESRGDQNESHKK